MSKELNEFELLQVVEDLRKKSIQDYIIRPGNNCIWVSYGRIDSYYIFRDSQIVDVQFD
jgi:hypothetical protein